MEKRRIKRRDLFLLPILLVLAVVPVVVRLKMVMLDDATIQYWVSDSKSAADIFSYFKAGLVCISTVIMLVLSFFQTNRSEIAGRSKLPYYLPVAVFAVLTILSSIFSQHPGTARNGFPDRYEGMFVLLAYMVILLFTMNTDFNEAGIRILAIGLFVSATAIGLIGILQFFGFDYFRTLFGQLLILPAKYHSMAGKMSFTLGPWSIYSTLSNPNYVGSYMAMLFPVSLAAFAFTRHMPYKIAAGVFSCLMFANLLGCRSIAGYFGGGFALIFALVLLRKKIVQDWKPMLAAAGCYVAVFLLMNVVSGGALLNSQSGDIQNTGAHVASQERKVDLQDIRLNEKSFSIVSKTETLEITWNGNQYDFRDTKGEKLESVAKDNRITFPDKRYSAYSLMPDETRNLLHVNAGTLRFDVSSGQKGFRLIGIRGNPVGKLEKPAKFGFEGMEKLASSRGYIWSRSIPLLKNTLLAGDGPDTFSFVFPQYDYIGKLRAFDRAEILVDKPYSFYLQTGINTGVLSLVAILVLFGAYFISSIRIYTKKEIASIFDYAGVAAFIAFCGFIAAGVFNDSTVAVSPVFWAILGIGIACNLKCSVRSSEPVKMEERKCTA